MSARRPRVAVPGDRTAAAPSHSPPRAAHPATAAARVLALQRSAGNAAVNRLLRIPVDLPARPPTRAAPPRTARERFAAQMRDRWSVAEVRVGTEADQVAEMRSMTPEDQPAPTSITGWQEWDPGPDSELYDDILDAFEVMAFVLGGVPEVTVLRFLASDYANVRGTAQARPRHGATYSGGRLNVFRRAESAPWRLPEGRSAPGSPAALSAGSASDSRRRIFVHELSHGVFERLGNPTLAGGSVQFFRDWEQAAGWVGGRLVQNGTSLTEANWNLDWPEQPVSLYSLDNAMEDFAESLMCFIEAPGVLSARSPARHAFIRSRMGTWGGVLRRPRGMSMPRPRHGPAGDFVGPSGDDRAA